MRHLEAHGHAAAGKGQHQQVGPIAKMLELFGKDAARLPAVAQGKPDIGIGHA
jgi:hypothetical protein